MDLAYHHDWPAARQRLEAFWRGERLDRPAMHITAPRASRRPVPQAASLEEYYFDPEYLFRRFDTHHANHHYLAEALPCVAPFMAGWLPAYGAQLILAPDTIWFEPSFRDWSEAPDWDDWHHPQFQQLETIVDRLGELASGRFFVGLPAMLPPNDLLAVLRGTENLLADLILDPEPVRAALARLTRSLIQQCRSLTAIVQRRSEGIHHHYQVWGPQVCTLQSDLSCMMSGEMYEEFVLPELRTLSEELGPAIYHVDGPDAIRHLERVCSVDGIRMIQWVAGAGQTQSFDHWPQVYNRAQELGRAIYLPLHHEQLEQAIRTFVPEQTFMLVGARDLAHAESLVRQAAQWTRKYWS